MQAIALVATLINVRLHQHLPHDASEEAQRIWKFVRRRLLVCQWSMAAVFGVQVLHRADDIPWQPRRHESVALMRKPLCSRSSRHSIGKHLGHCMCAETAVN